MNHLKLSLSARVAAPLLSLVLLSSCGKSPETTAENPSVPASATVNPDDTFGFMSQAPANVEAYAGFYHAGKTWQDIAHSKAFATLRSNSLVRQGVGLVQQASAALSALAALPSPAPSPAGILSDPRLAKWKHLLGIVLGDEFFVSFADGATSKLETWLQFQKEIRLVQFKGQIAGVTAPKSANSGQWMVDALPQLAPYLKTLEIPPTIMGFKVVAQKPAVQQEIDLLEKRLPASVVKAGFDLNGKPFKSWTFVAGALVPADVQGKWRASLEKEVGDKAVADGYFDALAARKLEIAFGYVGDYLLVSIGSDHAHLKLAASTGESLIHRPELTVLKPYSSEAIFTAAWTSQKMLEAFYQNSRVELLPFLEEARPALAKFLSPEGTVRLESDLRRLDEKVKNLFKPSKVQAQAAVSFWKDGLRGEAFGGVMPAGLDAQRPLRFEATDTASTFLWADKQADPAFSAALVDWVEDLTSSLFGIYHTEVLPKLPDQQRQQYSMVEALVLPKLTALYQITRDQFLKSLGTESALSMDLNGPMPAVPLVPLPIQQSGKMARVAILRNVNDPKLLAQSWTSYFNLAQEISMMLPPTMQMPGGLVQPKSKEAGGGTMYYYSLPMETGDLLPNVTIASTKDFIVSTSPSYVSEVSELLAKAPAIASVPTALKIDLRLTALYDFAEKWLEVANNNTDTFFKGDAAAAARFKKDEPAFIDLLKSFRAVQGVEGRLYEENGGIRTSSVLHVHDIP